MPSKTGQISVNTTAYQQLSSSPIGECDVTLNQAAGITVRLITDSATAPANGATNYYEIYSNSGAVHNLHFDPSKAWVYTSTGGGAINYIISW